MRLSQSSKESIDQEFQRIFALREIQLDPKTLAFLKDAQASLGSKPPRTLEGPMRRSLMHYAAMGNCPELLRYLLLNNAAVDTRDRNNRTPLSWAAEYCSLDIVKILLDNGAKINSTDDMYTTPLSWLIHAGRPGAQHAIMKAFLISKGASEKGFKRRWLLRKLSMF